MPQLLLFLSSLGPTAGCGPPLKIYATLGASDGASLIGDSIYAFRALLVMQCLNIVFEAKAMPTPIVTLFLIGTPLTHLLRLPSQWVLYGSFLDLLFLCRRPNPWFTSLVPIARHSHSCSIPAFLFHRIFVDANSGVWGLYLAGVTGLLMATSQTCFL
jgi:hypothetical protein